jgi:homoserine kinase
MHVRVPASSANLGPGFDTLGMALGLYAEVGIDDGSTDTRPVDARVADDTHPAQVAFRRHGGEGSVWVKSPIPAGRGMGFSGAVRVGGAVAAHVQRHGDSHEALVAALPELLVLTAGLEGHADNVAASLYGGVVATAADRAVRVPMSFDPAMVMWVPGFVTKTDESRTALPAMVPMADVVFNLGRTAMLVAALAAADIDALRESTRDRLHQDIRLRAAQPSAQAIELALANGAWASWLSGSGPTVAAMCGVDEADELAALLDREMGEQGHTKVLRIDHAGATIEP